MSNNSVELSKPKLMIGEGNEEVLFFNAFLKHLNLNDIQVEQYGGKQKLASYLKTLQLRSGYANLVALGITRDADDSAQSAFQSICSSLKGASLAAPNQFEEIVGESPKISVMVLPNNRNSGMLEDLCLASIETDPVIQCVDNYFECVQNATGEQPKNMAKAKVQAWLSSKTEPDKRLGEAAKAGYWDWDSPAFDRLKQFLQAL